MLKSNAAFWESLSRRMVRSLTLSFMRQVRASVALDHYGRKSETDVNALGKRSISQSQAIPLMFLLFSAPNLPNRKERLALCRGGLRGNALFQANRNQPAKCQEPSSRLDSTYTSGPDVDHFKSPLHSVHACCGRGSHVSHFSRHASHRGGSCQRARVV